MKIEKINKDNIKEYIRDMGIDITYVDEKQLINNTFGVKKDNKFLFGFVSLSEEGLISITFGDNKIDYLMFDECDDIYINGYDKKIKFKDLLEHIKSN